MVNYIGNPYKYIRKINFIVPRHLFESTAAIELYVLIKLDVRKYYNNNPFAQHVFILQLNRTRNHDTKFNITNNVITNPADGKNPLPARDGIRQITKSKNAGCFALPECSEWMG